MRISRRSLIKRLRDVGSTEAPAPSDSFVDGLERRLRALDVSAPATASNVRQLRRGLSRGAAIGIAATLASGAGAAAVAIVATRRDDPPTVITDTTAAKTTTIPVTLPSTVPTVAPSTTVDETTLPTTTTPTTDAPTTVAVAVTTTAPPPTEVATTAPPPPTDPPTTTPAPPIAPAETTVPPPPETAAEATTTSSTEVHTPATIGLDCVMDATSITCNWTPGPDGTDRYVVLRSSPSESRGRVLTPDPGTTTIVDIGVVPGTTYTYLVHALDAAGTSLAHSAPVTLACCG